MATPRGRGPYAGHPRDRRHAGQLTCNVGGLRGVEGQAHHSTGHLHHRRRLPRVQASPVQVPGTHEGLQCAPVPVIQPAHGHARAGSAPGLGLPRPTPPPPLALRPTDWPVSPSHPDTVLGIRVPQAPPRHPKGMLFSGKWFSGTKAEPTRWWGGGASHTRKELMEKARQACGSLPRAGWWAL